MYLFSFVLLTLGVNGFWTSENYPNPSIDFQLCRMKSSSGLCDPDGILVKAARFRLEKELKLLEIKSRPTLYTAYPSPYSCDKRGVVAVLALAKSVDGLSATELAKELMNKWNIDEECGKGVIVVDKQWGIARGEHVPLHSEDFYDIFRDQKRLFQQTDYPTAISNIILRIEDKSHQWERPRAVRGASKEKEQEPNQYPSIEPNTTTTTTQLPPEFVKELFWIIFIYVLLPMSVLLCCAYLLFCSALRCFCKMLKE